MRIALAVLGTMCYATMIEIQFHWGRLFAHWFPAGHDKWWNPSISWQNKYVDSQVLTFLLSTVFVPFTDFYHLTQFVFLNCVFLFILLTSEKEQKSKWWQYIVVLLLMNILWGIVLELTLGIYGALSDKYM